MQVQRAAVRRDEGGYLGFFAYTARPYCISAEIACPLPAAPSCLGPATLQSSGRNKQMDETFHCRNVLS